MPSGEDLSIDVKTIILAARGTVPCAWGKTVVAAAGATLARRSKSLKLEPLNNELRLDARSLFGTFCRSIKCRLNQQQSARDDAV